MVLIVECEATERSKKHSSICGGVAVYEAQSHLRGSQSGRYRWLILWLQERTTFGI